MKITAYMKLLLPTLLISPTIAFADCDHTVVDSLTRKALTVMAKRYDSKNVGMGVSIQNGNDVTTSVAIFQGRGGNDGVKVDRIGSVTVNLAKCEIKNTLIGTFESITLDQDAVDKE